MIMDNYLNEKLSDIIIFINRHPEDANIRLCSQARQIVFLKSRLDEIPKRHLRKFEKLINILEGNMDEYGNVYKIPYMRKATASKYITLLNDIHSELKQN